MKKQTQNHLNQKYISGIGKSPLFFTAPHSKDLIRGGKDYFVNKDEEVHLREVYTSFLACDFAENTGKNSFLFWTPTKTTNNVDKDPNFLERKHFQLSPFHQALHHWALLSKEMPLLHIDIHGKTDRETNCDIDVGIMSMKIHWKDDPLVDKICQFFKNKGDIFGDLTFKGYKCVFQTDPMLHGYWGGWQNQKVHTMTEQAILLGIPSLQLQIPFSMRKRLFEDSKLRSKFHDLFMQLYQTVIKTEWKSKSQRPLQVKAEIGKKFVPMPKVDSKKQRELIYKQIRQYEGLKQNTKTEN